MTAPTIIGSLQPTDALGRSAQPKDAANEAAWNRAVAGAEAQAGDPSRRLMASLLERVDAGELRLARSSADPKVVAISGGDGRVVAFHSLADEASSSAWQSRLAAAGNYLPPSGAI